MATIGIATISYASASASGCGDDDLPTSGNLLTPAHDAGSSDAQMDAAQLDSSMIFVDSGNLLPPPPRDGGNMDASDGAPQDAAGDAAGDALISSGNLVPPPPDGGSSDAALDGAVDEL